jgi:FixJ family two-component response regulator
MFQQSSRDSGLSGKTVSLISIVDDDESVRNATSSLLQSAGYVCASFPAAEAFLESDIFNDTDCLVLDIQMPGLSGLELQRLLRQAGCSIPVIFVTGDSREETHKRAFEEGAAALFAKPFNGNQLLGAIRSVLTKQS